MMMKFCVQLGTAELPTRSGIGADPTLDPTAAEAAAAASTAAACSRIGNILIRIENAGKTNAHVMWPAGHAYLKTLIVYRCACVGPAAVQYLIFRQLVAGAGEVLLDQAEAVLEDGDDADTAVDGVAEAHVGLVGERVDGVLALAGIEVVEDLGNVAGAEDAVHVHELLRVVRREIGREHAARLALAPQELARRARRTRAAAATGDRAAGLRRRGSADHGASGDGDRRR
jgi:hypothetical protein